MHYKFKLIFEHGNYNLGRLSDYALTPLPIAGWSPLKNVIRVYLDLIKENEASILGFPNRYTPK